jgi:sirohydrochlorin cobaltochelatase
MRRYLLLAAALFATSAPGWAKSDVAVLVMAHGGSPTWNKTVMKTVKDAQIPYPTKVYFGMGHDRDEVEELQDDVHYLEGKGARTIIVIPLLVSSYSEVHRQYRYLLGADINPGFNTNFFPIVHHAEIQFADPLNDDPVTALVLLDRAREISQTPGQETVVLVAHGPNDEADNEKWLQMMYRLAHTIRDRGGFKSALCVTVRDDAPTEVRSAAVQELRRQVEAIDRAGGKALILPMLMAPGGIENKVGIALKGLQYTLNAKVLLPDNRISQWIRSKIP